MEQILTLKQKILRYIHDNPQKSAPAQIAEATQATPNTIGAYLNSLKEEGLVINIGFGVWNLTDKGKGLITASQSSTIKITIPEHLKLHSNEKVREEKTPSFDLDDLDTIAYLKEKYGRVGLVKKLKNIIRILE